MIIEICSKCLCNDTKTLKEGINNIFDSSNSFEAVCVDDVSSCAMRQGLQGRENPTGLPIQNWVINEMRCGCSGLWRFIICGWEGAQDRGTISAPPIQGFGPLCDGDNYVFPRCISSLLVPHTLYANCQQLHNDSDPFPMVNSHNKHATSPRTSIGRGSGIQTQKHTRDTFLLTPRRLLLRFFRWHL